MEKFIHSLKSLWTNISSSSQRLLGIHTDDAPSPAEDQIESPKTRAIQGQAMALVPQKDLELQVSTDPLYKLLAFDQLFERVREAHAMDENMFESQGYADGKQLGDPKLGKAQIEHVFQAGQLKEEALASLFEAKIEAMAQRKSQLQEQIKRLEQDLDELDPESKAFRIQQQILDYQQKLQEGYDAFFEQQANQNRFEELLHDHLDKELKQVDLQQSQQRLLFEEWKSQFALVAEELKRSLTDTDIDKEAKKAMIAPNAGQEANTQGQKNYVEKARASMGTLHELYVSSIQSLSQQNDDIRDWYNGIWQQIRKDIPTVHSRFYIWVMGFFMVSVLLGEIYLINEMTAGIFGVAPDGNGQKDLPSKFYLVAHLLFCIGYPIGLGMIVKYYLAHIKAQNRSLHIFIHVLLGIGGMLIISVAILNVFGVEKIEELIEGFEQTQGLDFLSMLAHIGAFIGVSFVFSTVTGFIFFDFFESFEEYIAYWDASPFEEKPEQSKDQQYFDARQRLYKKVIKRLKQEQADLLQALNEKQIALQNQEADISRLPKNWNFKEILENLKKAAVAAYLRGYQKGRMENQGKYDYEDLIDFYRKSKITQNYPNPLLNGTHN